MIFVKLCNIFLGRYEEKVGFSTFDPSKRCVFFFFAKKTEITSSIRGLLSGPCGRSSLSSWMVSIPLLEAAGESSWLKITKFDAFRCLMGVNAPFPGTKPKWSAVVSGSLLANPTGVYPVLK